MAESCGTDESIRALPLNFYRAYGIANKLEDQHKNNNEDLDWLYPRDKGYTAVGFIFKGEVFVAADHPSKSHVDIIVELNPRMLATLSGGGVVLLKSLQKKFQQHEHEVNRRISVGEASKWMADVLSSSKKWESVEMLIGGLDKGDRPALYHVDGKGKVENCEEKLCGLGKKPAFTRFACGSGYRSAIAVIHFRLFRHMSADEAVEVAKAAVCWGVRKAIVAGSFVSVFQLGPTGLRKRVDGDYVKEWINKKIRVDFRT